MDIVKNLILLTTIVTLVIDMTDFIPSIKGCIKKQLNIKGNVNLKPFDCSLCSSWWLCLIYLIYSGNITLEYIAISLLLAVNTGIITTIIRLFQDIVTKIVNLIYKYLID